MVRKTITQLTGIDPEYSKQFVDEPKETEAPAARPLPADDKPSDKPKDTRKSNGPARSRKPATPVEPIVPKERSPKEPNPKEKKQVNLMLFPLVRHRAGLDHLTSLGVPGSDVVKIAGRRTIAGFEPKASFIELPDAERLPASQAYKTNKTVDASIVTKVRSQADPLNLRGDGSLLRGQVEPLFWQELDAVILELKERFQKKRGLNE